MLFEILSRETDYQLKVFPANIGEFVFQKSANPENVLFTVLLYFYYSNPWAPRVAREHQKWVGWGTGWGKIVRFNHTCISRKQLSMGTPKWTALHNTALFLRYSCLSLKPDWRPSLPWAACYSHTAMLPTDQGGLSHTSIVQISLQKLYHRFYRSFTPVSMVRCFAAAFFTHYSYSLYLIHKLICTLLLNLWACSILSVFPTNFYYSWISHLDAFRWQSAQASQHANPADSCVWERRVNCASLLTSPGRPENSSTGVRRLRYGTCDTDSRYRVYSY